MMSYIKHFVKETSLHFRYTIMRNCWKVDPNERPSFKEIRDDLYSMLTDDEVIIYYLKWQYDQKKLAIFVA